MEYLKRLEFHKNSKNFEDLFFLMKYTIYTDGACSGNPGPGGWGAVIFDKNKKQKIFQEKTKILQIIEWN